MIEKTYNTTNNNEHKTTAREDFELTKEMATFTGSTKEELYQAKEEASKARVDRYSNEKATEQNKMYEEYMNGALKENFSTQTQLNELQLELKRKEMEADIAIQRKELEADIRIQKKFAEAEIKLQKMNKEIRETKFSSLHLWIWRIFYPLLGIGLGALVYFLLNFIK